MKFILLILAAFLVLISFKAKEASELTVDHVVQNKTADFKVKGEASLLIERRYSIEDTVRKLSNEFHIMYNELGQVTQYIMFRMTHYSDSLVMEKSSQLNYFYAENHLIMVESFSYRDSEVEPDSSERSYVKYTYDNSNEASYKAYRYGDLDHIGEINIIDNLHATERVSYPENKLEPVLYEMEFDTDLQLIKFKRNYVYQDEKKVNTSTYVYAKGRLMREEKNTLIQNYSYQLDENDNWIKRTTTADNGTVVEELEREIFYR